MNKMQQCLRVARLQLELSSVATQQLSETATSDD